MARSPSRCCRALRLVSRSVQCRCRSHGGCRDRSLPNHEFTAWHCVRRVTMSETEKATEAKHHQERQKQWHKQNHQQSNHAATKQPTNRPRSYICNVTHHTAAGTPSLRMHNAQRTSTVKCPPLFAGALWPMPAWVWRDVRFFFIHIFFLARRRPTLSRGHYYVPKSAHV